MSDFASRVIDATLETELGTSFGRYARATILARAIPDARDGLKPVQRRIVYAMFLAGNTHEKRYRKCAKTVGDVMGSFHPHGDSSIYDAMVRLAQYWKLRHPLVDGHGNFGSIDDDPPAAMRYTEARLAAISQELTRDIKKNTVAFQPTFDDSDVEPTVLPARFPALLVNGTSGVSTGFATEIQPHNLGECIDAVIALIDDPEIDVVGLMDFVKGPDFPTGGIMMGLEGLQLAYETGRGRVVLRGRTAMETARDKTETIVISEIPYGVIKSNLVKQIERLRVDKIVPGIRDVRDESDREGLRIVVDLKRGVDATPVLAFIHKKTDLQVYRHFQMVAIVDNTPKLLGLKPLLEAYLEHQRDVVRRRSRFDLDRAQARLHIVDGLMRAVDILDEVIATIRGSKNRAQAHERLMERFEFSDLQSKEILDLRLHRLTSLQILQLKDERKALLEQIEELTGILGSHFVLMEVIRRELLEVRKAYADERRTTIEAEIEDIAAKIEVTVTVKPQPQVIGVSRGGYVKRSSQPSFAATEEAGLKVEDSLRWILQSNTLHRLLLFTTRGRAFAVPVHQLPEAKWGDVGTNLVNLVGLEKDDAIVAAIDVESFETADEAVFVTRTGAIKRTPLKDFDAQRSAGVTAMKVAEDDEIVTAGRTDGTGDFVLFTMEGNCIRFEASEVPSRGRSAGGVRGMKLNSRDTVLGLIQVAGDDNGEIGVLTCEGRSKRTGLGEFPRQKRGGRGVRLVRKRQRDPHRIGGVVWWPDRVAQVERLCIRLSNWVLLERGVSELQNAARDGRAYEFEALEKGVEVAEVYRLGIEPEGGEEVAEAETTEVPAEAPETAEAPLPDALTTGQRGGWAQANLFGEAEQGSDTDEGASSGDEDASETSDSE